MNFPNNKLSIAQNHMAMKAVKVVSLMLVSLMPWTMASNLKIVTAISLKTDTGKSLSQTKGIQYLQIMPYLADMISLK